jgi:hypothetical protein
MKVFSYSLGGGNDMDGLTFCAEAIKALAWPGAAIGIVVILRVALRSLLDRIKQASVGGDNGPIFQFESSGTRHAPTPTPEKPVPVEGVSFGVRVKDNVANTYWLGADLMTLFDVVLRGGKRDEMLQMFRQANHHMKVLRLRDVPLYERFQRLYEATDKSLDADWTADRRRKVALEIHSIVGTFGRLVEATQPGFSGNAETSADL